MFPERRFRFVTYLTVDNIPDDHICEKEIVCTYCRLLQGSIGKRY